MEYTHEQYIEQLEKDKEELKERVKSLTTKKGNEEYKLLRNKLAVIYAKLKYHTDPETRDKRLNDYNNGIMLIKRKMKIKNTTINQYKHFELFFYFSLKRYKEKKYSS